MSAVLEKWKIAKISEFAKTTSGGTPSRKNPAYYTGDIPWIKSGDLNDGNVSEATEFITEDALKNSSAKLFPAGTLMIALYGATIGKLGILQVEAATNQAICGIFVPKQVDTKYLFYFFLHHRRDLVKQGKGGAQPNISQKIIRNVEVSVAPLPEQRRIVARIEELFSHLDAGVAALRQAKAQLQRYRQSVLAAAVTGQLTQAWREQHPDTEPAEELLERILKQRRESWNGRGKYKEGAEAKDSLPFDLPKYWAVSSFDQISSQVTVGHVGSMKDRYQESGIPFLRSQNVRPMRFAPKNLVYIDSEFDAGLAKSRLYGGEILLTRSGANVGQCCVYPIPHGQANCSDLVITRPLSSINPQFGALFMNSPQGRRMLHLKKVGAAQAHFNVGSMKVAPLPLPPLAEQNQIVAEVEDRTTVIDHLEAELDRQITRSNRLRQSTLSSAFQGAF
jgi:type I restriction enzyme S subunit